MFTFNSSNRPTNRRVLPGSAYKACVDSVPHFAVFEAMPAGDVDIARYGTTNGDQLLRLVTQLSNEAYL